MKIAVCVSGGNIQAVLAEPGAEVDVVVIDRDEYEAQGLNSKQCDEAEDEAKKGLVPIETWGLDQPVPKKCVRCGSKMTTIYTVTGKTWERCGDHACPFSDHDQTCQKGWAGHPGHPGMPSGECTCSKI